MGDIVDMVNEWDKYMEEPGALSVNVQCTSSLKHGVNGRCVGAASDLCSI